MEKRGIVGLIVALLLNFADASCPDDDPTLMLWSDAATWTDKGLSVPSSNADVKITNGMNVKLNVDLDVRSISIEPTGRLVWDRQRDSVVRTHYIYIQGTMEIGSEDCKFNKNAQIILKGTRDEVDPQLAGCGQKFICVASGGTLELHGKDKLSWTKLVNTLNPLKQGDGIFYQHQKSTAVKKDWVQGLRVYEFDSTSKKVVQEKEFYLSGGHAYWTNQHLPQFGPFIDSITDGNVIAVALLRQLVGTEDLSEVYNKMESLGSKRIRDVGTDNAYAFIALKGDPASVIEDINNSANTKRIATVSMDIKSSNQKIVVTSQITVGSWSRTKVDFVVFDWDRAYPIIDLVDNPQGWEEGDRLLFTSTDFDMEQAEIGVVESCKTCGQKQIRVDLMPKYMHWATVDNNIDMRGEVAMLTRKIQIRAEIEKTCPPSNGNCNDYDFDTFGGHVKFLRNFKNVHVEGVQLDNMGQATSLGNYPLHFHMCHDTDGPEYPNPPYLRKNTINRSFARCVTIHGSHGVTVQDNVCMDTLGHSIFLEDGGEKRTVVDGNLVALTRKGKLIPSDEQATSFWITNPLTTLRNNVAAGSEHTGIWIIFPDEPSGPSAGLGFMALNEAKHTKVTEVSNNLAHSNMRSGFFMDNMIDKDQKISGSNRYYPRTMPTDPNNPLAEDDPLYIEKLTCWKNRVQNVWARGGLIIFKKFSSSDSAVGMILARGTPQEQFVEESVFVGESNNIGMITEVYDRSTKRLLGYPRSLVFPWDDKTPIQGFSFYDGPIFVKDVWFGGFQATENYTSGALGFRRFNRHGSSPVSSTINVKFGFDDPAEGNRVYDGDATVHGFDNKNGDRSSTFRDVDKTVTGLQPIQQIVKPGPFYTTHECLFRTNWNMAICPHRYGKLDVQIDKSSPDRSKTEAMMLRDDLPNDPEVFNDNFIAQFMAVLGGSYSYTLHWTKQIPTKFRVIGFGVEKDKHVRFGMCVPPDGTFDLAMMYPIRRMTLSAWTEVFSIEELDSDTVGDRYFHDKTANMVFVKFMSYSVRSDDSTESCGGTCPGVWVTILSGDRSNGDCRDAAYVNPGKYKQPATQKSSTDTSVLKGTAAKPPSNWGAGSQLPFTSRQVVDGGWSDWTGYDACSVTCGGGSQAKYRYCNNPSPANGGTDCTGVTMETISCNGQACPVGGAFSNWSSWTVCKTSGNNCQGYKERSRTCSNPLPANNGKHCTGSKMEQEACDVCP